MHTNLDYENASKAVKLIKSGFSINEAAKTVDAKIELINIMLGNEDIVTKDVFVEDSVRLQRESMCASCEKNINNICMVCACPLPTITNIKFKECPLGKW